MSSRVEGLRRARNYGIAAAAGVALYIGGSAGIPDKALSVVDSDDQSTHVSNPPEIRAGHTLPSIVERTDQASHVVLELGIVVTMAGASYAMIKENEIVDREKRQRAAKVPETPWHYRGTYEPFRDFINGIEALDELPAQDSKKKS